MRALNQAPALVESKVSSDQDALLSLMDIADEQQLMETLLLQHEEAAQVTDRAGGGCAVRGVYAARASWRRM